MCFWLAENVGIGFVIYTSCLYSLTLWADFLFAYTIAPSTPTPLLVFLCNYSLPIKKIQWMPRPTHFIFQQEHYQLWIWTEKKEHLFKLFQAHLMHESDAGIRWFWYFYSWERNFNEKRNYKSFNKHSLDEIKRPGYWKLADGQRSLWSKNEILNMIILDHLSVG